MEPSEKRIVKIKATLEKKYGREFTRKESEEVLWDIQKLGHLAFNIACEKIERDKLLKDHPKGFHLNKTGYSCCICGQSASMENSWYDKYGLKCIMCQNAINSKVIPTSVAKDKKLWYTKYELEIFFNLKGKLLNQCLKQGFLKDRIIQNKNVKSVHLQLFLINDNKKVLPPKKLLKSRIIKVMKDEEEYYTTEYWYEFVDQKLAKQIAKYQITAIFPYTFSEPIETERFYTKKVNPVFSF